MSCSKARSRGTPISEPAASPNGWSLRVQLRHRQRIRSEVKADIDTDGIAAESEHQGADLLIDAVWRGLRADGRPGMKLTRAGDGEESQKNSRTRFLHA